MDYLRGNAAANASGIYVICRYLSGIDLGMREAEVKSSLRAFRVSDDPAAEQKGGLLDSSLLVATELGLLELGEKSSQLALEPTLAGGLAENKSWLWFRGELSNRMIRHALDGAEGGKKVPDLILALTWFLQLNPLKPPVLDWDAGPSALVRQYDVQEVIANSEQWRAFQRWAVALGFARRCDQPNARVLIPDASTAISDQLVHLPSAAAAQEWLAALLRRMPVLGDASLTNHLPPASGGWSNVPPGLVIGLLKMERHGILKLEQSDDSSDVVAMGLSSSVRQIGRIARVGQS